MAALTLAILAGIASSSRASLILSDAFSYPDGNLTNVSGGTWYAHGNIGGIPLLVNNGQVRIAGANLAEDDSANLAGGAYTTNSGFVLYSSYTLIISNAAGLPSSSGNYISHFKDAFAGTNAFGSPSNTPGFSFHGLVWLSATNVANGSNAAPGTFMIGIGNASASGASATSGQLGNILTTNVTYRVVTRMVLSGNQDCTLWLNPNFESDPGVTATDVTSVSNRPGMAAYAFRQAIGSGTAYVDNLRVGTSFADVAPFTIPATNIYPQTILADNPIAFWRLNEGNGNSPTAAGSGVLAHDYAGVHDGVYTTNVQIGAAGYSIADPDTAASFETLAPSNSYVGSISGIDFSQQGSNAEFSVEAWVRGNTPTADNGIVTLGYGGGGEQFSLDAGFGSHRWRFFVRDGNSNTITHTVFGTTVPDGNWHHLVGVCDQTNAILKLYIDGALNGTASIPIGAGVRSATTSLSIGARKAGTGSAR